MYDSLGNRLTKETASSTIKYDYDENNRLVRANDTQFFYDERGNLVKKISPGKTAHYVYDLHDNLIAYSDRKNEVKYTYDGEGRRISKTVNGKKTSYINDVRSPITQVLAEVTEEKKIKNFYTYGLSRLNQMNSNGSYYYLHDYPDRNVVALVDNEERLCNHYEYEAFGLLKNSTSKLRNDFTYASEAYEEETGLIYLRNRYYDPEIGRFVSADPSLGKLTDPQSFNPYAYANNNPINFIDPLGLRSAKACAYPAGTETKRGKSITGHGFWVLTEDNGEVTIIGRYPGEPKYKDKIVPGTVFHEWPATDAQINQIIKVTKQGPYLGVAGNCIDGLERGLKVLGVEHPSFSAMGVSVPTKAIIWLESLNGKNDFGAAMKQDLNFIAAPDVFSPAVRTAPTVTKPQFSKSVTSSGDFGGVSFDKSAQLIGNLGDILGATYDSATGQLILIGSENYSMPVMDFDDLAVAVRSIYGLGGKPPQDPGVSIDLNPDNTKKAEKNKSKNLHPMLVRYDGATQGTRFGQIMFEADRLLKCLSIGKDNITEDLLKVKVPGFISLPNRYADPNFKAKNEMHNRLWFVPKEMLLTKSPDGKSILFDRAEIEVLTESKRKNKQRSNSAAESFAKHFTDHFDVFSAKYPILAELKRLGKITAIVKWIKDNQIPLDLSLFNSYTPKSAPTPSTTPTIWFPYVKGSQIGFVTGGVVYHLSDSNFHEVFGEKPVVLQQGAINSRPSEDTMEWKIDPSIGKGLKAVAHTIEHTRKIGNIRKMFIDMRFPFSGELSLELVRYYNSFNERSSGFGKGWELNISSMYFPRKKGLLNWKETNVVKSVFPDIFISDQGREVRYVLQGLNSASLPIYRTEGMADLLTGQEDGSFTLNKENLDLFFDSNGKLLRKTDKQGQSIQYAYANGRLTTITHQSGKRISLEYQNDRITSSTGPGGKMISYQYDSNGQLHSVSDPLGPLVFYGYDAEKNLNAIYDAKKQTVFTATYDSYHRAITISNGKTGVDKQFSLKDHVARIQGPNHLEAFQQYDANYRLLRASDSLGRSVEIAYQNGQLQPTLVKDSLGNEVTYDYDNQGNLCTIKDHAGLELRYWYDSSNRLIAAMNERKRVEVYLYDAKGRLKYLFPCCSITNEHPAPGRISFKCTGTEALEYTFNEETGAVLSIKKGDELAQLFDYDAEGRLIEISDPYGYKIKRQYDDRSRLASVRDSEGGFDYSYNERDQIIEITSPVGSISYNYDEVGNLIGIKDANGYETHLEYDENYNLIKVIDASGGTTSYAYTDFHSLTSLILPNGSCKKIVYDSLNHPIQEISGEAGCVGLVAQ